VQRQVPLEMAECIPKDRAVQVIILFPEASGNETTGDEDWRRLTRQQFLKGYAEGDATRSTIRLHKLATIERSIVGRKLGRLHDTDWVADWTAFQRIYREPAALR
jgi:hypothetical protein